MKPSFTIETIYPVKIQENVRLKLGIHYLEVPIGSRVRVGSSSNIPVEIEPFHVFTEKRCVYEWDDAIYTSYHAKEYLWTELVRWKGTDIWPGPFMRFDLPKNSTAIHPNGLPYYAVEIKISTHDILCHPEHGLIKRPESLYHWLETIRKQAYK